MDGLVVTLIVHALNRDSVNYLSFQSPTASDRLFFFPSPQYILCLICQCVSSEVNINICKYSLQNPDVPGFSGKFP